MSILSRVDAVEKPPDEYLKCYKKRAQAGGWDDAIAIVHCPIIPLSYHSKYLLP
ncbi:MAG: hypothetical protein HY785_25515 [Oscillatoriophycideae cyanobacterium NC_groundwater_1537_Pr4_S-0.65um_50_18]|nr:hypothetical protein [Oscillatoriophycideae cyanobacterium NC_groundwater_1537_Pr4_S-0.65um_50_18]